MRRIMLAVSLAAMFALSAGPAMADDESFTEVDNDVPAGAEEFIVVDNGGDSAFFVTDGWDEVWNSDEVWDFANVVWESADDNGFETVNDDNMESDWQIIA